MVSNSNALSPGDLAMFGSPQRWEILQQAIREGRRWFYGDHAYFGRRLYFRITRNAYQHDASGWADPKRFEQLGIAVKKWRHGNAILLCPNSPAHMERFGTTAQAWIDETTRRIREHTDRPIRVRFKTDPGDLEHELQGSLHAVVVFMSVCGVHAAMAGVPCFATAPCASMSFGSGDLSLIENPVKPDNRYEMACVLAANQWTLHEMASGQAWKELNK